MATWAPFLRKLVTAYFDDRKTKKDDNFSHVRLAMQSVPIKDRLNVALLLEELAKAVRTTTCQHTDVTKQDDWHETCNTCGLKRLAWEEETGEEGWMETKITRLVWSSWRP
jgi:hypothetical protein